MSVINHTHNLDQISLLTQNKPSKHSNKLENIDQVFTKTALQCFNDIKVLQAKFGNVYKSKKWIAVNGSYLAAGLGIPSLLAYGISQRGITQTFLDIFNISSSTIGFFGNQLGYWGTGVASFFGGCYAVNDLRKFKNSTILWSLAALTLWTSFKIGSKISEKINDSYLSEEEFVNTIIKKNKSDAIKDLTELYQKNAQELKNRCELAKDNPKAIIELKSLARMLHATTIPLIRQSFSEHAHLNSNEIDAILKEFSSEINNILNIKFKIRTCNSSADKAYNAILMTYFKPNSNIALTPKALIAASNTKELGWKHQAQGFAASLSKGLLAGFAVPATLSLYSMLSSQHSNFSNGQTLSSLLTGNNNPDWLSSTLCSSMIALSSLTLGAAAYYPTLNKYQSEFEANKKMVQENCQIASTEATKLYDGIADYFAEQQKLGYNLLLKNEAKVLLDKLPVYQNFMTAAGLKGIAPKIATLKLEAKLNSIINTPKEL